MWHLPRRGFGDDLINNAVLLELVFYFLFVGVAREIANIDRTIFLDLGLLVCLL